MEADGKLNQLVAAQLQKTKMCAMNQRGICREPNCRFAHSQSELRTAPNLAKTAICRMYTNGQCRNSMCKFAHGEKELRVTPCVYKTQLCNFHTRGHCKKGSRCRHAHGQDELRAFSEAPAVPPSTFFHDDTQSSEAQPSPFHNAGHTSPDMSLAQDLRAAGYWSPTAMMGTNPDWWAALLAGGGMPDNGGSVLTTPPTSHLKYSQNVEQLTPEKFRELVPPFPGMQHTVSDIPEPMKISLPASRLPTLPGHESPEQLLKDAPQTQENLTNMMNFHAQCAWAAQAQAKMDYELVAAQLKVQELQAKRQLYSVAQLAASANATGVLAVSPVAESHFNSLMQTPQKLPSRPMSPADAATPQPIRVATPQSLDTAVDSAQTVSDGGFRTPQQRGTTAFII